MLTTLPFQGFYCSQYDAALDHATDYNVDNLAEQYQVDQRIIADALWKATDYRKAYLYIAKKYVDYFNDYLKDEYELDLNLTFESLQSPREYNFETDRIFCHISPENLRKLRAAVPDDELNLAIKVRFTSRSGFISSYPNRLEDWNPDVTTWDHNEIGTLFVALLSDAEDFEFSLYEQMQDKSVFDMAFDLAVDWTKFEEFVAIEKEEAA